MIISKRKKFLISFVSLLSIFSLLYIFPASAASYTFTLSCSRPQISESSCYIELVTNTGGIVFYVAYLQDANAPANDFNPLFTISFSDSTFTIQNVGGNVYTDSTGQKRTLKFYGYYVQQNGFVGSFQSVDGRIVRTYSAITEIYAANGYNCNVQSLGVWQNSLVVSYGNESVINNKLDDILAALEQQMGEDYNPAQPDPDVTSGIGSAEAGEESLISGNEGNYNSAVSSGNSSILNFFNSAGNSLIFVKTLFNNLVADKVYILVICSVFLAVLPVLINVAGGLRK